MDNQTTTHVHRLPPPRNHGRFHRRSRNINNLPVKLQNIQNCFTTEVRTLSLPPNPLRRCKFSVTLLLILLPRPPEKGLETPQARSDCTLLLCFLHKLTHDDRCNLIDGIMTRQSVCVSTIGTMQHTSTSELNSLCGQ